MPERTMNRLRCVLFFAAAFLSLPAAGADPLPVAIHAFFSTEGSNGGTSTVNGVVSVQATLASGWHTYSVTEAVERNRTRITLAPSGQVHQSGAIRSDVDPRR